MPNELTKEDLKGYGIIAVSEWGEVITKTGTKLMLTYRVNGRGKTVEVVNLYNPDKLRSISIPAARVAWVWFHGKIGRGEFVHHKDGSGMNNSILNLYISNSGRR